MRLRQLCAAAVCCIAIGGALSGCSVAGRAAPIQQDRSTSSIAVLAARAADGTAAVPNGPSTGSASATPDAPTPPAGALAGTDTTTDPTGTTGTTGPAAAPLSATANSAGTSHSAAPAGSVTADSGAITPPSSPVAGPTAHSLGPQVEVYGNYAGGSANIRSGPGTSFPVIGGLPYGKAVTARLVAGAGWYLIRPGRYISGSVVSTVTPPTNPPPTKPPAPRTHVAPPSDAIVTDAILAKVNAYRTAAGVPELRRNTCADASALSHSKEQAARHSMYHRTLKQVEDACNMPGGENIAYGYSTIDAVLAAWYKSTPHRENMLNPQYTYMGAAVAYSSDGTPYYTQAFYIG